MTLRETLRFPVRREIARRTNAAHHYGDEDRPFPAARELDSFDFEAQPGVDPRQCANLRPPLDRTWRYDFPAGPPGVGKSHLAVALGREVIRHNYSVLFTTAATLVASLVKAHRKAG